jgi:hypothetical protein
MILILIARRLICHCSLFYMKICHLALLYHSSHGGAKLRRNSNSNTNRGTTPLCCAHNSLNSGSVQHIFVFNLRLLSRYSHTVSCYECIVYLIYIPNSTVTVSSHRLLKNVSRTHRPTRTVSSSSKQMARSREAPLATLQL